MNNQTNYNKALRYICNLKRNYGHLRQMNDTGEINVFGLHHLCSEIDHIEEKIKKEQSALIRSNKLKAIFSSKDIYLKTLLIIGLIITGLIMRSCYDGLQPIDEISDNKSAFNSGIENPNTIQSGFSMNLTNRPLNDSSYTNRRHSDNLIDPSGVITKFDALNAPSRLREYGFSLPADEAIKPLLINKKWSTYSVVGPSKSCGALHNSSISMYFSILFINKILPQYG